MPNICIDGICGQRFFKDSLFFEAQWLASNGPNPNVGYYSYHALASTPARQDQPHSPPYYIVSGSQRAGSYLRYSAIVDSAINYVSPLLCETSIVSYNAKDKLLTINNRDGSALISTNNDILLPFQRKNLLGGFKWRGKVYAYCQAKKLQLISGEDSNIVRGWENVSLQQMPAFGYDIRDTNYEFVVQDSLRKVALIWPDGTKPYPALNFLYQDIRHISDGCFMVSPGDYKGLCKLVDAHNKELLPGVTIRNITAAKNLLSRSYSGAPYQSDDIVPDLYLVTTADYKYFFIDRYGRAYTNAKKITTPAKWP